MDAHEFARFSRCAAVGARGIRFRIAVGVSADICIAAGAAGTPLTTVRIVAAGLRVQNVSVTRAAPPGIGAEAGRVGQHTALA